MGHTSKTVQEVEAQTRVTGTIPFLISHFFTFPFQVALQLVLERGLVILSISVTSLGVVGCDCECHCASVDRLSSYFLSLTVAPATEEKTRRQNV